MNRCKHPLSTDKARICVPFGSDTAEACTSYQVPLPVWFNMLWA